MDKTFDYSIPEKLLARVVPGVLVRVPFGGRVVRGFVLDVDRRHAEAQLEPLKGVVVDIPLAAPPMDQLISDIAARYVVPRGRAFARLVPPRVRVHPSPTQPATATSDGGELLVRYEGGRELMKAIRDGTPGEWCLQVLPGEDRGALIGEMVTASRGSAIVLVPEVRYGSLTLDRLAEFVPGMHRIDSVRSDMERSTAWVSFAASGGVAGGGRSTVVAPSPDLGLIVVDEEHHQTYKEDRAPRHDTRWVARHRARLQNAVCVLMSASPSVETGGRAYEGITRMVTPTRQARRFARPLVELVPRPEDASLGPELHQRITVALREGQRVALLVPSPSFARAVWCGECRRSLRCERCEAGLFFDRGAQRLRCARCGWTALPPDTCPSCGAADFKYLGAGTERLAEQLPKAFPRARVWRVDPADPGRKTGDVDLYVTTWIGTKAVLRPDVSLVGVLDADWLIRRPDLRAAESAHQALVEMSEWAGPASEGGRLVIQTAEPGHHSLQAVVRGDYTYFLRKELELRRELSYPPYVELIRITARGHRAGEVMERTATDLRATGMRVLGPAPLRDPAGEDKLQSLVKTNDVPGAAAMLRGILETLPKGVRMSIDVDPR